MSGDRADEARAAAEAMRAQGFRVTEVHTVADAERALAERPFGVVFADLAGGVSPQAIADILRASAPGARLLVAAPGPESDCERAPAHPRRRGRNNPVAARPGGGVPGEPPLLGASPPFRQVVERAARIAATDAPVLVTGESGTGKTRLARLIHDRSARRSQPFVVVNCAAIPVEAELFGHSAGAFTGAGSARKGLFESANGGTLVLDEVGETPLALQAKLLHAIEAREIRRVGESRTFRVDARVIAATNQDLPAAVAAGRFRADLFYRLAVLPIAVPPLRARREDIPLLLESRLEAFNRRQGTRLRFSAEVLAVLAAYDYPGNVRELDNLVDRMALLATGAVLGLADLPSEVLPPSGSSPPPATTRTLKEAVDSAERAAIERALAGGGSLEQVAAALGVSPVTLWRKMRRFGLRR